MHPHARCTLKFLWRGDIRRTGSCHRQNTCRFGKADSSTAVIRSPASSQTLTVVTCCFVRQGKHIIVLWYSIIMHLRRQPVLPKNSRLWLYLYPKEFVAWEEADVRPLYLLMQIGHHIARLRDKGILSDGESVLMAQEVKTLTQIFGTMEAVRDTPTIPFVYYQFCNWMALLYCLTGPCHAAPDC